MSLAISVVVPAFNESRTIIESMSRCFQTLESLNVPYEVIVVDDGSEDNTVDLLVSIENHHLKIVKNFKNLGKGASIINGCKQASGEYICFLDADLDIDCRGIRHFYSRIIADDLPVDIVIGSKVHKDSTVTYPFLRRIQSKIFKLTVRFFFRVIEEPVNVTFNFTSSVKLTSAVTMAFDVVKIKRKSLTRITKHQQ